MEALYALFSGPVPSTGAGILVSCGRTSNQGGHRSKARARLSSSHHQGSPRGVTGCLTESWCEQGYLGLSSHLAWRRAQNSQQGKITPYLSDRPPRDIGHNKNVPMPFPNTHTPLKFRDPEICIHLIAGLVRTNTFRRNTPRCIYNTHTYSL